MATDRPRVTRVLRSGWIPAILVWALAVALVTTQAEVSLRDALAFSAYVVLGLTLPGTILWRLLRKHSPRPLVEDLVLGTLAGYAAELPAYAFARLVGHPRLMLVWPVAVVALGLALRPVRRRVLQRSGPAMSPLWSWTMAAVLLYATVYVARYVWFATPITGVALRHPYVDEPFHLAMVGEFRHHLPAQFPYVDGTTLYYHWLSYLHVASSSWVTGIEPIVLLRELSLAAVVAVTILGASLVAVRLTRRTWAGPLTAGLLVLGGTADVYGMTAPASPLASSPYFSTLPFLSPTHGFATMMLLLPLLLAIEAIRRDRTPWWLWLVILVLLVELGGSKSTMLPTLISGFAGATLVTLALRRRLPRAPAILTVLSAAAFLVAQQVFYGPGTRSLTFSPLKDLKPIAVEVGLVGPTGDAPTAALVTVAVALLVANVAAGAGCVGLLIRGGWRRPLPQVLVATYLAGFGASILLSHPGGAERYFLKAVTLPLLLLSSLGVARLVPVGEGRRMSGAGAVGVVLGVATALGVAALTPGRPHPVGDHTVSALQAVRTLLLPPVLAVVVIALAGLVAWFVLRGGAWPRRTVALIVVSAVLATGLVQTGTTLTNFVRTDWTRSASGDTPELLATGGVRAARWLRSHSTPDEVVATNAHCTFLNGPDCDRRNFWMTGFSERRFLVEGWAYVAPETVGQPSTELTNSARQPFWKPALLKANDAAFTSPSPATIGTLKRKYDVRWMFVDLRFPVARRALGRAADLRFRAGSYAIYRIR